MAYLVREQIKEIHIEPTSRCNLLCPQCARTHKGGINPELPISDIPHEVYESLFDRDLCQQLAHVYFCGNYGDPVASPELLNELQFLRSRGVRRMTLFTNGSLQGPDWWRELAKVLNGQEDKIAFSIDGLQDTNSLYRVNASWEKVMENCQAFISAGGNARWDWLMFSHNEHQVEEARELSRKIGFSQFNVKATARFVTDKSYKSGKSEDKIKTRAGELQAGANKNLKDFNSIINRFGSWKTYVNQTSINCKYQYLGALYLDFESELWPCCWTGAPKYFVRPNSQREQLDQLFERYGRGFNSLKRKSLDEILHHPWFQSELIESWSGTMDDANPKLMACGRTCGTEYEFTGMQGTSNSDIKDLKHQE